MGRILILYFLSIGLLQSCKPIPINESLSIDESYKYSYYVLNFNKKEVMPLDSIVYQNTKSFILLKKSARYNYDPDFIRKEFSIVKEKDTMNIFCFCGPSTNYYFKKINFRKGSYIIKSKDSQYWILTPNTFQEITGKDIKILNEKAQKILFKNKLLLSRNPALSKKELLRKDVFFKDLEFKAIDFSDTENVKLESVSKEEFWNDRFLEKFIKKK